MQQSTFTQSDPFPESPLCESTRSNEDFEILGLLGTGGMGMVHLARQRSVDRMVALKTLKAGDVDDLRKEQLVREGWVLGELEHPNIPPIHTIGRYRGGPAIVLKCIQGQLWSKYLRNAQCIEKSGHADELAWHLGVLLKVVDAVRFAHSRGILHRDLKPSNVMIGEFGEVYLMDWGLAASVRGSHEGIIQLARDVFQTAGTYAYMAPEMLEPQRLGLSERTDIYQLGGMLYQLCTGKPPHWGDHKGEIEGSIRSSRPGFGAGVPHELMLICRRAMAARPNDRYESADAFRRALEGYLTHRGANALAHKGEAMLAALSSPSLRGVGGVGSGEMLAQCRFAFQQSLEIWGENQRAVLGLSRCDEMAAENALLANDPEGALRILRHHPESPLKAHCLAAYHHRLAIEEEVETRRQRGCQEQGRTSRRYAVFTCALVWVLLPLVLEFALATTSYASQASCQLSFLSFWLLVGRFGLGWVASSELNERCYTLVFAATILALVIKVGSYWLGLTAETAQVYDLFVFFAAGLLATLLIEWRLWLTALAYLTAFIVATARPQFSLWAMSGSNLVLAATALYVWRQRGRFTSRP